MAIPGGERDVYETDACGIPEPRPTAGAGRVRGAARARSAGPPRPEVPEIASRPRLWLLGPMAADAGGRAIELGPPRRRALLALLAVRLGNVVPAQQLLEELWGDRLPDRALPSLHSYISHLRRALSPRPDPGDRTRLIHRVAAGYVLDLTKDEVDVHRFENAVAEGRRLHRDHRHAEARDLLRTALDMWRGTPYEELVDYPVLAEESERLARVRLSAVETWADACLVLGDLEPVAELDADVRAHPGRERLAGQVMTAQYRLGRQADALHVYARTRDWLAGELGVDAGEELQRLHRAILRQELPTHTAQAPALPARSPGPTGSTESPRAALGEHPATPPQQPVLPPIAPGTAPGGVTPEAAAGAPGTVTERRVPRTGRAPLRSGPVRTPRPSPAALPSTPAAPVSPASAPLPVAPTLPPAAPWAAESRPPSASTDHPGTHHTATATGRDSHGAGTAAPPPAAQPHTSRDRRSFVGRESELAALRILVADLLGGKGRLAAVLGEPGIGKSRLLSEVAQRVRNDRVEALWGYCFPGPGTPPYWLWTQVLRQVAASRPEAFAAVRKRFGDGLSPLLDSSPDEHRHRDRHPEVAPDRFRTYDAVCETLLSLADDAPLLLMLEDLHWADAPSLQLLRLLTSRLNGRRLGIVITARTWEIESDPELGQALGETLWSPRTDTIKLDGLPEEAVSVLVSAASGPGVSRATVQRLHERSKGNPYFVNQLMSLLGDPARLHDPRAVRRLFTHVPSGVREVLTQRFAALPEATRDLLRLCAVIGSEIDPRLLAEVSGHDDAVCDHLEPALRAQLLSEDPAGSGGLHFTHALVRETLYGELSRRRRAQLHARIAETLAARPAGRHDGVEQLAHHAWEGSRVLSPAKALPALCRAGEEAELRLAYEQAEMWLRRAIDLVRLLPPGDDTAPLLEQQLQIQLGQMLATTRGYGDSDAEAAFTRSRALNPVTGATDQPTVLWSLCTANLVTGRYDGALGFSDRLRAMPGTPQDPVAYLGARYGRGIVLHVRGRLPEALAELEDAVERADALGTEGGRRVARYFQHDPRVSCRSYDAFTRWLMGDEDAAAARRVELLALTRHDSRPNDRAFALYVDAVLAALEGDVATARNSGGQGREVADRYGLRYWTHMLSVCEGWAVAHSGEPDAGIALLTSALSGLETSGTLIRLPLHLGFLADALHHVGRVTEAGTALHRLLQETTARGEHAYLLPRLPSTRLMRHLLPEPVTAQPCP
ncbi:BTAD domain-containing putative transcriptional regulator [Streptomyces sp. NRRL S-118]|uniref:BTAD domain-containing putative transcriptional regulator n=1 Tax=Streptomyces sp. NRRL S-118 TaxID=1463881 RepID=UPI00099B882F|nr:BTAD domain-containing putative transcriptional regulator [Streptomyces sp. NRRL S-118]